MARKKKTVTPENVEIDNIEVVVAKKPDEEVIENTESAEVAEEVVEKVEEVTEEPACAVEEKVEAAVRETYKREGIYYIRTWLNEGELEVGDDIMYVLIGGDIRPNVVAALDSLVDKLKTQCVTEKEI